MIETLYVCGSVQLAFWPTFPFVCVQEVWHTQQPVLYVSNNAFSSMPNYDVYAVNHNKKIVRFIKRIMIIQYSYLKANWSNEALDFRCLEMLLGFSFLYCQRSFNNILTYIIFFLQVE